METDLLTTVTARRFDANTVEDLAEALAGVSAVTEVLANAGEPGGTVFVKVDLAGDPTASGGAPAAPSRGIRGGRRDSGTCPVLIGAVARLFRAAGCNVLVGDSPFADGTPVKKRWEELGLYALAELEGFQLVELEAAGTIAVPVRDSVYYVARPVEQADLVVNLAAARRDPDYRVGGLLTNMAGVLPGFQKIKMQLGIRPGRRRGKTLADLYAVVAPSLSILEAASGELVISTDGIAADVVGARLAGFAPQEMRPIDFAAEAGLGIGWMEGIRVDSDEVVSRAICEREVQSVRKRVLCRLADVAAAVLEPWVWGRPVLNRSACDGCGDCVKICPTRALRADSETGKPSVNEGLCIGCWGCQSSCSRGALKASSTRLTSFVSGSRRRTCVF